MKTYSSVPPTEPKMETKLCILFLLLNVSALAYCQSSVLRWESASKVSTNNLLPSGREDNYIYYVARGMVKGFWLNGKSLFIGGQHTVYVPFHGKEAEGKDFQVLVAPPGSVSWVYANGTKIPDYWIAGGTDPTTGETTFICRAWHGRHLIVGRGLGSEGTCVVAISNKSHAYKKFGVLALNSYGVAIGAAKVPAVPAPVVAELQGPRTKPLHFLDPYVSLD